MNSISKQLLFENAEKLTEIENTINVKEEQEGPG
jgi:hypothetical protein